MLVGFFRIHNKVFFSSSIKCGRGDKKGIMEEESLKHKSLYLCFMDKIGNRKNVQVIQSIRLSHLLAPPVHGGDDLKLKKVASRCGPYTVVPITVRTCVIGSKIIFPGGSVELEKKDTSFCAEFSLSKEVSVFETDPSIDPNSKLQPSHVFKISRAEPVLVEVDNKLYRFNSRCDCESFEIFENDDWLPLDVPPRKYNLIHAIVGTKILLWGRNQNGLYIFDVTHPEKGWTELDPNMGSYIQSIDGDDELFVKLKSGHGDGEGEGFLMFSINLEEPDKVLVSHMSHTCDSLKPLKPLQLPTERSPKFNWLLRCRFDRGLRCRFFHLGGQKVGLVFSIDCLRDYEKLGYVNYHGFPSYDDSDGENEDEDSDEENKYDSDGENEDGDEENKNDCHNNDENDSSYNVKNEDPDDNEKASVVVIIFKYEFVEKSMDIRYKSLTFQCVEYSTKDPEEESWTRFSFLIGVHVL